jgi:hypothetical protein
VNAISLNTFVGALLSGGLLLNSFGAFYGAHLAGKKCSVVLKDGRFERGTYLRFIGEGHLIRLGGRVFFVAKDQVKEIMCGDFKITKNG